jgi:small subunit ribosomal protein S17
MPRRILKGVVISDKADKTLTVKVERRFSDPFFKKTVRSSKKNIKHMMRIINLKSVIL